MFNSAQRTFILSILNFNAQRRLTITEDDKIKVNKFDLYYENRTSFED